MKNKEKFWNPNENESIEAVVVEIKGNVGKYKNNLYKFKVDDEIYCLWGSVLLNELFEPVQILDRIHLKYLGKIKSGEYYMKNYQLDIL